MKLICGLGNVGEQHASNRHNTGFLFLDYLSKQRPLDEDWQAKNKFLGQLARVGDWWLLKPTTMMNLSGRAVASFANFYKLKAQDLVVIHDDLDLRLGNWKLQLGVGPKIHNGILSVEQELGTADFWRLRLGVDNREAGQQSARGDDYVLSNFSGSERQVLQEIFPSALKAISEMLG